MRGLFQRLRGQKMDSKVMGELRKAINDESVEGFLQYSNGDYATINLGMIANTIHGNDGYRAQDFDVRPYNRFVQDLVVSCLPNHYKVSIETQQMSYRDDLFHEGVIYVAKTKHGSDVKKDVLRNKGQNQIPYSLARTV